MDVEQALQEALQAHRQLLNAHHVIWEQIQKSHASDSQAMSTARRCLQRTEQMIEQCSDIKFASPSSEAGAASGKTHKRPSDSADKLPQNKKARTLADSENRRGNPEPTKSAPIRQPVTKDPSGLFLIDSNPADIDHLLKDPEDTEQIRRGKPTKRKHIEGAEATQADTPSEASDPADKPTPAKRQKDQLSQVVQDHSDPDSAYYQSFEQKVALRLKEKDEERKKKSNKKRKRESEASREQDEDFSESGQKQKPSKKPKIQDEMAEDVGPMQPVKGIKRKKGGNNNAVAPTDKSSEKQKQKKKKQKKVT